MSYFLMQERESSHASFHFFSTQKEQSSDTVDFKESVFKISIISQYM